MSRPRDPERRKQLVDALIDAAAGGLGGRSLREMAEAVGTSHRNLLHHFGTREGVLLAVVEEVERRQAGVLETLPEESGAAVWAMWESLRRPELRPFERLFFECYARGAQGEPPFDEMVPSAVEGWLSEVHRVSNGAADAALARLGLAVTRGLLLDLVATDDVEGVDAAMALFVALIRRRP